MTSDKGSELFNGISNPEGMQIINSRCVLRTKDGLHVVSVSGISLAQYAVGDRMSEAHAMVSLVNQGWADQNDVAKAFGCSERTVRRYQRRFEEGGLAALGQSGGYPRGHSRSPTARQQIQRLKTEGHSHYEIARRLGISVRAVRKTLRRLGWKPIAAVEPELPLNTAKNPSANSSAPAQADASIARSGGEWIGSWRDWDC